MSAIATPLDRTSTGTIRLFLLFARSRGTLMAVAGIVVVSLLFRVLERWASFAADGSWGEDQVIRQYEVLLMVAGLLASVIGGAAHSPFGEQERSASSTLPWIRGIHLALLLVLGLGVCGWWLSGWESRAPEVEPVWLAVRNVAGLLGLSLLAGRWLDSRLTFAVPMAITMATIFRVISVYENQLWSPDWWWVLARPTGDGLSWAISIGVFAAGVAVYLIHGPRDAAPTDASS